MKVTHKKDSCKMIQRRGSTWLLRIPAILGNERTVMHAVHDYCQPFKIPIQRVRDVQTAVSEACINAIEHGNALVESSYVNIRFGIRERRLHIEVEDAGMGFTPHVQRPDIDKKIAGQDPARGWGLYLIEQLVDEVQYIKPGKKHGAMMRLIIDLP